jgi:hypothetical protein
MCLLGFDSDPLDAKKRSAILQKRRYQTLVSGLVALKGVYVSINRIDQDIVSNVVRKHEILYEENREEGTE